MKFVKATLFAAASVLLASALAQPARAEGQVSFDFAYSNLSQHGSWLVSARYGRVWQPREYNRGWNPYYDGHWVDTDMGWTWVSDYPWGSLPYHYGTWYDDASVGWVWVPGEVWAPSWVVFRTTPEYIGWTPVPPGFSVGVSMDFGAPSSFIYVSSRNFLAPQMRTAIIPAAQTNVFVNNTTVVNNIVVHDNVVMNRGPDVRFIEKATGQAVRQQPIEQVSRVAPFAHVTRARLAVAPERATQGVRAAVPVPESRPLPVAGTHGRSGKQGQGMAPVAAPTRTNASAGRPAPAKTDASTRQRSRQPTPAVQHVSPASTPPHRAPAMAQAPTKTNPNAKKGNPAKKDHGSGKGGSPDANDASHQ